MKVFGIIIIILLASMSLRSQVACDSSNWAKEGTYEIVSLTKDKEVFTTDLLCQIETSRKDYEIFELQISPITIVRIYPRKKAINKASPK
jgi:hypothetical protein